MPEGVVAGAVSSDQGRGIQYGGDLYGVELARRGDAGFGDGFLQAHQHGRSRRVADDGGEVRPLCYHPAGAVYLRGVGQWGIPAMDEHAEEAGWGGRGIVAALRRSG